jgi:hypothetical protein
MTAQEVVRFYDQNVYQIRLMVAVQLMLVRGHTPDVAIKEADEFVFRLLDEDVVWLQRRFESH